MVATRAILPGDEITYDYCTSEDCELSPSWECHCGASNCRRRVTPTDWSLPELQQRYRGHFLPHIAAKIAEVQPSRAGHVEPEPLCAIDRDDSRGTWWLRLSEPAESIDAEFRGVGPSQMPGAHRCLEVDRRGMLMQARRDLAEISPISPISSARRALASPPPSRQACEGRVPRHQRQL